MPEKGYRGIEWDGLEWQERVARKCRMEWSRVVVKDVPQVSNGMVYSGRKGWPESIE